MKISVALPVYNEQKTLEKNTKKLLDFLKRRYKNFEIVIADNASTDKTTVIGKKLARTNKKIKYFRLNKKGRGRALKAVWKARKAGIVAYMDIDLSTNLRHFPELIKAIENGSDIAIGSRLSKNSIVKNRKFLREVFSRGYNTLIKLMFFTSFTDAQCGFKAARKDAIKKVIPKIKNNNWFFDSEMLIIGEKMGYKIRSVPVKWTDDPGTTVNVLKTSWEDLKGLIRLRFTRPWRKK